MSFSLSPEKIFVMVEVNVKKNHILIIEDESSISELLKMTLSDSYFLKFNLKIDQVESCEQARILFQNQKYDLVLLDWMLPGEQGIDFLRSIKNSNSENANASFLMMTAKSDSDSIVQGLGADDYVTKPFDFQILKARIKNILNRKVNSESAKNNSDVIELWGLVIDFAKVSISVNNQLIHLTPSEFKLLGYLLKSQGRVLTRDQLIDLIQGQDVTVTGRTIDTHVFALRKKLGAWSDKIETIRGVGYRVLSE
jgi:two-component system, OmpR family, phosphate regulon response regulator PhoB